MQPTNCKVKWIKGKVRIATPVDVSIPNTGMLACTEGLMIMFGQCFHPILSDVTTTATLCALRAAFLYARLKNLCNYTT